MERTRESVEYRRKTGRNLGGRPKTAPKKEKLVLRLREEGESLRAIREQTGLAVATIRKILDRNKEVKEHKQDEVRLLMEGPRGLRDALQLGALHKRNKRLHKR